MKSAGPILTVLLALLAIWYGGAVLLNRTWTVDQAARQGEVATWSQILSDTMHQDRPVLPPPHQVMEEVRKSVLDEPVMSKRSLVYHALVTLTATLTGFLTGTALGVILAVAIVHSRAMDLSVMPWAIISQTIPIVALAPMIVVLSAKIGIDGRLVPKTVISAYLAFFPVLVSMVTGLRSPNSMQLDLLKTYGASDAQTFLKLRLPASLPYFFASLKIAMAASLVGAIVGEMPTGAVEGLGARMLIGSQFGQPLATWAALVAASVLAALLIVGVGLVERGLARRMGAPP